MTLRLTVTGLGYLGLTHAVAMAKLGYDVIGVEIDPRKVEQLQAGVVPFYEPGLQDALNDVLAANLIHFKTAHDEDSYFASAHFLCVGTPEAEDGSADLTYVHDAVVGLRDWIDPLSVIVGKSTVPVGTSEKVWAWLSESLTYDVHAPRVAWNPEFLREGTALQDSLHPDRIVVGASSGAVVELLRDVYAPLIEDGVPFMSVDTATAELVKMAANSFLATKISFINAMSEVCEKTGADVVALAKAIGADERIGKSFLRAGIGFGGGCFPKDLRAFRVRSKQLGLPNTLRFLDDVDEINQRRRRRPTEILESVIGDLSGKRILVLGAAFKPDSDDVRDSPALAVAADLWVRDAEVLIHDPMALDNLGSKASMFHVEPDLVSAFDDVDAVVLGTEWADYRNLDPATLNPKTKLIVDGRNVLDVARWQAAGWSVYALGRSVSISA